MAKTSAGLIMYRRTGRSLEVLLVHPGGPFWAKKELGAWSIPKGEVGKDEEPLVTAKREFEEETGIPPSGEFLKLQPVKQAGGKVVFAWAFEGDCDPSSIRSNLFEMEWPPKSGRMQTFPEIDRAEWFGLEAARTRIFSAQTALLEELERLLDTRRARPRGRPPAAGNAGGQG